MSDFRKPWERRDGAPSGGQRRGGFSSGKFRSDRPGFRKPWEGEERRAKSEDGSFSRPRSGFRKPWESEERRAKSEDGSFSRPRSGFRKPWESREDRGEGDGGGEFRPRRAPRGDFRPARKTDGFSGTFSRKPRQFAPRGDFAAAKPWKKPRVAALPAEGELLYGRQPVREILRAGRRPVSLVVFSDGVKDSEEVSEIKALCEKAGVKIEYYKREDIEAWTSGANHQGVCAFCAEYPYAELDEVVDAFSAAPGNATVVVLDHVQDPQNLGSILRTCECAGVSGVVLPVARAVAVTPAAVRASAGASEHLKIARVSNLVVALERFKGVGAWITGLEAVPSAKPYVKVDYSGKTCLVIGSESHGICSPVRRKCDFMARLPLLGSVNSLNAGVAAALALYEILRQHGVNDDPASFPAVDEPPETDEAEPSPDALPEAETPAEADSSAAETVEGETASSADSAD